MKRTTIRLPEKLTAAIHARATGEGRTASEVIRHTLNHEFGFPDAPKLDKRRNPELKGLKS